MNMNQSDVTTTAEDRSQLFWWLSEWFLAPPSQEQLGSLPVLPDASSEADVTDVLDKAWQALSIAASPSRLVSLDQLGVEFTRLFAGVQEGMGPPPPFESVWREDRLIGESTLAVIKAYVEAGFADIEPEAGPQDHIGVELKFLSLLALREAEAWKSGNDEMARKRVAQQQKFLQQHLGLWAPRWADSIIEQSREPLYAALAGLLKAGLAETQFELSSLLKQAA
jgi:TorA maturation chaperone TorD